MAVELATRIAARPAGVATPVETVRCLAYRVPTDQPEADGTLAWSSTTVCVVEVAAGGETGLGWTYAGSGSHALAGGELGEVVEGTDPMDVAGTWQAMVRACRNLGYAGAAACAVSALDVALWDLKAKMLGIPLVQLFGRCRDAAPLYGSGGFTSYDDATLRAQMERFLALGMAAVKLKVGESWGAAEDRDLARVALTRQVVGDDVQVFVDANGGYTRKQAVRAGRRMAEEHGVVWFEEPVSSDDLAGLREVRDQVTADVAAGEYGYDPAYFARMAAAGAVDCLQIDATRCGGYSGWLQSAAVAAAHHLQVSAHCAPSLHAPVVVSVPNLRHIEYFHDHARLDPMLFDGIGEPAGGELAPGDGAPGHGFSLREAAAERWRVA